MHRITSSRYIFTKGFTLLSNFSFRNKSTSQLKCLFCNKIHLKLHIAENILVRHHGINANVLNTLTKKPKVKRKNRKKKYGEVIEVNDDRSKKLVKVSIRNINAVDFSKLVPGSVSLGQCHNLRTDVTSSQEIDKDLPFLTKNIEEPNPNVKLKDEMDKSGKNVKHEYDNYKLIFSNHEIARIEKMLETKQFIDEVKQSYYIFQQEGQRMPDNQYGIREGQNPDYNLKQTINTNQNLKSYTTHSISKSPHPNSGTQFNAEYSVSKQKSKSSQDIFKHMLRGDNILKNTNKHREHENNLCDSKMRNSLCPDNNIVERGLDTRGLDEESRNKEDVKTFSVLQECVDEETTLLQSNLIEKEKKKQAKKKKRNLKKRAEQDKDMRNNISELNKEAKQKEFLLLVRSHIQLLCTLQLKSEAKKLLQYYMESNRANRNSPKISDINAYNYLLHGYASVGSLKDVKSVLSLIQQCGVDLNAQTYAAVFECIERSHITNKLPVLNHYHEQMKGKGFSLNDLMDKSKFLYDQRETVLSAIRRIEPHFEPQYTPPDVDYHCPLLDKLRLENTENRQGLLNSPVDGLLTFEDLTTKAKEQLDIEYAMELEIENVAVRNDQTEEKLKDEGRFKNEMNALRMKLKEAFLFHLKARKSRSIVSDSPFSLYYYLRALEVDQYVEFMLKEIKKLVVSGEAYSPTLGCLQHELGVQVYQKYQQDQYLRNGYLKKLKEVYEEYCKWYVERRPVDGGTAPLNNRQAWQLLVHRHRSGASLDIEEVPWSADVIHNVGKFLYDIIIKDIHINVNMFKKTDKVKMMPIVYKVHRTMDWKVHLELKPHPVLMQLCSINRSPTLNIRADLAPSRAPPVPWVTADTRGPFLVTSTPLIRVPFNIIEPHNLLKKAPPVQLYPVLDSLNHLGEVPWIINRDILDLQLKIFRAGGDKKLNISEPASAVDVASVVSELGDGAAGTNQRRAAVNRARHELHSLWCDALYKLSLANHYRDCVFWLPQNMDFRGRVYAVGPHVSVLGGDMTRGLLLKARGRPLGPHGLRWLKLHAINLTGTRKKEPLDKRLEYVESIIDKLLDSADRPLDGEGWWMESEDPWQTLACCMEIAKAMRSPNPEEYVCRLSVHQDGSCNGLQHYAALGADAAGAAAVNLAPAARPQDVYSDIAALVEKARARDAADGVAIAVALDGCVSRKVVKQTIMTTVYGVTMYGARLQIAKQLKEMNVMTKDLVSRGSQYLTVKTFESLREMFTSTKLIQTWFTECADLISRVCGESVQWVTPLGLPVIQPYFIRSSAKGRPSLNRRPCTLKQRNGFPPNFIHSLDSSHMMLTSLHCAAAGITFVSVHDCFWTHPDTVDAMNEICREQFLSLYSRDIIADLSRHFTDKYCYTDGDIEKSCRVSSLRKSQVNMVLQRVLPKGNFDVRKVKDSTYFFS